MEAGFFFTYILFCVLVGLVPNYYLVKTVGR